MASETSTTDSEEIANGAAAPGLVLESTSFADHQPLMDHTAPQTCCTASSSSRTQLEGSAKCSTGVQAVVQRRASRGMQTGKHVCATCTALFALNQKVCQAQADFTSSAEGLLALASSATKASKERAHLESEVATARARMERTGFILTEADIQQREADVRLMPINDETKASCLELLTSQRQELLVFDSLTARHDEAVVLEQTIMREQAALQHTAETSQVALVTAIHELGVWIQAGTSQAPLQHTGPASEHTVGTALDLLAVHGT